MVKNSSTIYGQLYVVATPIGNLKDITQRAIDTLKNCALIAAEDTRHSKRLMQQFGIDTPLTSLHNFNEQQKCHQLLAQLQAGKSIALISDAGTPLISDPGFSMVRLAREEGVEVIPIPGCSALITALSASGLPCQQFFFAGFLPAKASHRKRCLQSYTHYPFSTVIYESTHRLLDCIADISEVYGHAYHFCLAKELTKSFEHFELGTATSIMEWLKTDPQRQKGEFVLILPNIVEEVASDTDLPHTLQILLKHLPLKQAVKIAVDMTGMAKNAVYQMALAIDKNPPP